VAKRFRTVINYDEDNKRIYLLGTKLINDNWENDFQMFIHYTNGLPDSTVLNVWNDGWQNDTFVEFVCDNPEVNSYTSAVFKDWYDSVWVISRRITLKYDSNLNNDYNAYEKWNGYQWVDYLRAFYSFNSSNLTLNGYCEYWNGDTWVPAMGELYIEWMVNKYGIGFITSDFTVYYTLSSASEIYNNPEEFELFNNYPNPFNPSTTIKYSLASDDQVSLIVYDILGREVQTLVNEYQRSGIHEVRFNANQLSSGIYFYRLKSGNSYLTKTMILEK
jgi:hypothetical protein